MGHKDESFDDFIEAHRTCLNDIMYFPTRHSYGLSSVAGNMEKIAALQDEFENVKKKMDDDTKKAQGLENKIKILTNGYQMRAGKLWSQVETIHKQMDTAETELQCFQALQKQEQLAASNRINDLWEEVQKQKELEKTLQKRYGDLLAEKERIQNLLEEHQMKAQMQEESRVANSAVELPSDEVHTMENETSGENSDSAPPDEVHTMGNETSGENSDSAPPMENETSGENSDLAPPTTVENGVDVPKMMEEQLTEAGRGTGEDGPVQGMEEDGVAV